MSAADKCSELNASLEKPESRGGTDAPPGMRYAADTRQRSVRRGDGDSFAAAGDIESTLCNMRTRGYLPIENYGIIGNLRTVALCGTDGSIDFCCYPRFDSPTVFARLLDRRKGGHFSVSVAYHTSNKQQYMPKSNILVTRFLSEQGVAEVTDYMHIPEKNQRLSTKPLLPWIIRSVRVMRGKVNFKLECYPAFNYARDTHTTYVIKACGCSAGISGTGYPEDDEPYCPSDYNYVFESKDLTMDLRYIIKCADGPMPNIVLHIDKEGVKHGLKGPGVYSEFEMDEMQEVVFIFREKPKTDESLPHGHPPHDPPLTLSLMNALFRQTISYWQSWIDQSEYRGRWRENVLRSVLTLKLLTYEPVSYLFDHSVLYR